MCGPCSGKAAYVVPQPTPNGVIVTLGGRSDKHCTHPRGPPGAPADPLPRPRSNVSPRRLPPVTATRASSLREWEEMALTAAFYGNHGPFPEGGEKRGAGADGTGSVFCPSTMRADLPASMAAAVAHRPRALEGGLPKDDGAGVPHGTTDELRRWWSANVGEERETWSAVATPNPLPRDTHCELPRATGGVRILGLRASAATAALSPRPV